MLFRSRIVACGLMLMALIFDHKLATRATILAMGCLVLAFLFVPVAFMAAVRLVVVNNSALALLITVIGGVYTSLILVALLGFFPVGIRIFPFRQLGRFILWILIACGSGDRPPVRSWWNKERVLNGFESLMDLYEIENSMKVLLTNLVVSLFSLWNHLFEDKCFNLDLWLCSS